jgi:hypothetical protein
MSGVEVIPLAEIDYDYFDYAAAPTPSISQ